MAALLCVALAAAAGAEIPPESVKRIRQGAEQGDPAMQYSLGALHHNGEGVEKDLEQAARWFRAAAEQGHGRAEYHLARCKSSPALIHDHDVPPASAKYGV